MNGACECVYLVRPGGVLAHTSPEVGVGVITTDSTSLCKQCTPCILKPKVYATFKRCIDVQAVMNARPQNLDRSNALFIGLSSSKDMWRSARCGPKSQVMPVVCMSKKKKELSE